MKTRTLSIVAFVAVAFTAGWNYQQNKQNVELPELVLENIEALANGEESGEEDFCWSQFSGGLAWPRQCPSCQRLPFATGVGTTGTCIVH